VLTINVDLLYQCAYDFRFLFKFHRFLIEEGKAGSPKMMSIGLHCRLARPGRVSGIAEFLDFVKSHKRDVWVCTREQIADFWYANHYPRGGGSPMKERPVEDVADGKESADVALDVPTENLKVDFLSEISTDLGGDVI
jgi:hypothetical protein